MVALISRARKKQENESFMKLPLLLETYLKERQNLLFHRNLVKESVMVTYQYVARGETGSNINLTQGLETIQFYS